MNVDDLMRRYAWKGVEEWRTLDNRELKRNADHCLGGKIAQTKEEASYALRARHNDPLVRFIPMPRHPRRSGDEGFFFTPVRHRNIISSFEFACVAGSTCIGLRFEPPQEGTHRYTHFQFTSRMLNKAHGLIGMPKLPESYPAFPTGTTDTLNLFLYIVIAVHGYEKGALELIVQILSEASMMGHLQIYSDMMRKVLAATAEPGHQ